MLAQRCATQIAKAGSTCEEELDKAIQDADDFSLDVEDVTINGNTATAKVKGKIDGKDEVRDFQFEKDRDSWRATSLQRDARLALARRSAQRAAVLALVVRAVVAGADRRPPVGVVPVPVHRPLEALVEAHLRLPAERADLLGAERVAAVVAGPVGDVLDQVVRRARERDDPPDDVEVDRLVGAADVVRLAGAPWASTWPMPRAKSST